MIVYLVFLAAVIIGVVILVVMSRQKREVAWKKFASELGGEFVPGGFLRSGKIQAHAGQAVVTIDTYSVPSGDTVTSYTRMRAPFQNKDGFQFTIQRKGLIGRLDKALGTKHIDIGDADFDHDFMVQGNNEFRIQSLLLDQELRRALQEQRSIQLAAKGSELRLEVTGVVKDIDRLKALFKLFQEMLDRLER